MNNHSTALSIISNDMHLSIIIPEF